MNAWLWSTGGVLLSMVPCGVACFRGDLGDRVASLGMLALLATIALVLIVEGFGRPSFFDVPLTLAILCFGSGMVFARFAQRWL